MTEYLVLAGIVNGTPMGETFEADLEPAQEHRMIARGSIAINDGSEAQDPTLSDEERELLEQELGPDPEAASADHNLGGESPEQGQE